MCEFARSLEETQAWMAMGSCCTFGHGAPVEPALTDLTLPVPSDGESEVGASDEELPTPKHLLSKVSGRMRSSMC